MDCKYFMVGLLLLANCHTNSASVLDWIWGQRNEESTVQVADGVPLVQIPYESMTEDEKFLKEAAKFTEIQVSSPLETCQHKVIMKIKTSCADMTEEELAKLSVNLLNCQSAAEGRKTFPCTGEMSLKQCTTDMDSDMWNAYHLMSNRARAVCYAARGTQFRALTELTVNKLMSTAHTQIEKLSALKEGQEKLEEQTTHVLSSLSEGNRALLEQQQHLKDAQTTAHQIVAGNLRELTNERALIRSGHAQLAAMADDIRRKLEEASQQLMTQAVESSENHREILQDLMKIQGQAEEIWNKIESSTARIFEQQEEAMDQYEATLQKLMQINDTIHFIWDVTNTMRMEIDEKLNWITGYIGDTGEQMHRTWRSALHVIYLMGAMIAAAFLQAPFLTRLSILCIVPLNLFSFLKHGMDACLDFASMTVLILLITTMHYVMVGIHYLVAPKKVVQPQLAHKNGHIANSTTYSMTPVKNTRARNLLLVLQQSIWSLYIILLYQLKDFAEKCKNLARYLTSWNRQSVVEEELSCSYQPSHKSREDLINGYARTGPALSEDETDISHKLNPAAYSDDDYDYLVDANELRRRLKSFAPEDRSTRSVSRPYTPSLAGSVTPSMSKMPRPLCVAVTKSGGKCRSKSMHGRDFCRVHARAPSTFSHYN